MASKIQFNVDYRDGLEGVSLNVKNSLAIQY